MLENRSSGSPSADTILRGSLRSLLYDPPVDVGDVEPGVVHRGEDGLQARAALGVGCLCPLVVPRLADADGGGALDRPHPVVDEPSWTRHGTATGHDHDMV
jgi:hypothetical protein